MDKKSSKFYFGYGRKNTQKDLASLDLRNRNLFLTRFKNNPRPQKS